MSATFGFSARFTGGGTILEGISRLISPDLRGGGGEGGCEGVNFGDLVESSVGVWDLLGIRKCLGEPVPEFNVGVLVDRCIGVLERVKCDSLALGGDCGGNIVTEGGACCRAGRL